eukprot:1137900-Pelagomonas_calceolata.AAC.6
MQLIPVFHLGGCVRLQVPDVSYDFVARNQGFFRVLPLWAGGIGGAGILANRILSGAVQGTKLSLRLHESFQLHFPWILRSAYHGLGC